MPGLGEVGDARNRIVMSGVRPAVQTLQQRIATGAARGHDVTFVSGDLHITVSWSELHDEAWAMAAGLQARGIRPSDHVAILGPT